MDHAVSINFELVFYLSRGEENVSYFDLKHFVIFDQNNAKLLYQ